MKIPHLDQLVELSLDDCHTVAWALSRFLEEATTREQYRQRLYWHEALALAPLEALRRRLVRCHASMSRAAYAFRPGKPARPPKPRRVRVPLAELVALRECHGAVQAIFSDAYDLAHALGKFHQKSCNLEPFIRFTA